MPPLTLENAGALVPGGVTASDIEKERKVMQAQKPAPPATLKGEVVRAFYYQGKLLEVGAKVELPRIFALEMHAANKLRFIEKAAPAPEKVEAPASKKESRDAR